MREVGWGEMLPGGVCAAFVVGLGDETGLRWADEDVCDEENGVSVDPEAGER